MKLTNILAHNHNGMYECFTNANTKVIAKTKCYFGHFRNITFEEYAVETTISGEIRIRGEWQMRPRVCQRVAKTPYATYVRTPKQVLKGARYADFRNAEWTQRI